jgi:hypothetical protein
MRSVDYCTKHLALAVHAGRPWQRRIDGILGEDILRTFSAVRIDYKGGFVAFEK